jgi:MSHA pilin protein MshC
MLQRESSSFCRRGRIRGFSLLEVVIVLVMVGVLAVFAAPRVTTTQSITLPSLAAKLVANIRYTQSLAMSQGQRYRINFTATTYQITDMSGTPIVQPLTAGAAAISVAPASLTGFNPPLTNNYVAFDSKGVPYISATSQLAANATITLTAGSDTSSVVIAPETGRVK